MARRTAGGVGRLHPRMPPATDDLRASGAPLVTASSEARRRDDGSCRVGTSIRPERLMSTLVVAWVDFPMVLLAVTLGCGLALEALARRPLAR